MSRTASPEKRAEWRRRMERFGRSCVTVADFCRSESVSIATFYYPGLFSVPLKAFRFQWVRIPPGNLSLRPVALGAVQGGNELD